MTQLRYSFLMPAYNAEATITRALDSVLAQTFSDWELIVVDDGSSDETATIIDSYAAIDERIKSLHQANAGCGAARDTAGAQAQGAFLVRFDADDELLPNYLQEMDAFIRRNPDYDIYCCNGWHVFEDGSRRLARPGAFYDHKRTFILEDMFTANRIFTMALYTRELFARIKGIDHQVYCEDFEFWTRAFAKGKATCCFLPKPLGLYYITDSQMTADVARIHASRIKIYQALIESGDLTPEQIMLAQAALERTRHDDLIFAKRNAWVQRTSKLFGKRAGKVVSRLIHGVGKVLRPVAVAFFKRGQGSDD